MASVVEPNAFKTAAAPSRMDETATVNDIRAISKALKSSDFDIYSELSIREMATLVAAAKRKNTPVAVLVRQIVTSLGVTDAPVAMGLPLH
jgi:hypothetical protein